MILIADGGSTKVDWRLINEGEVLAYQTPGINPFIVSENVIEEILNFAPWNKVVNQINEVHYYGAGLATDQAKGIMQRSFVKILNSSAVIHLNDDLLGAARALFNHQPGIACILGTGSNSCYFDGIQVVEKIPALGYILGDEGSGAHIGKLFINALLKRDFPTEFSNRILKEENLSLDLILEGVYKKGNPNRYLASFTQIMIKYIDNPMVEMLIADSFNAFLTKNVLKYPGIKDCEVGFVGSIAYHFESILRDVLSENQILKVKIIKAPIDNLVAYHSSNRLNEK